MDKQQFLELGGLDFQVDKVPTHVYSVMYDDDYNQTPFFCTVNKLTRKVHLEPEVFAWTKGKLFSISKFGLFT